jgi:hypothetical protein
VAVSLAVLPAAASASHIFVTGGGPPFDVARAVNAKVSVGTPFGAFPGTYQQQALTNNSSCPPTCFALTLPSTPFGPVTVSGITNCLNVVAVAGHDSLFKGAITTTSNGLLMPVGALIVARLIDGDAVSIPFPGAPDRAGVFLAPAALPALCSLTAVSTIPLAGGFVSVHQH